MNPYHIPKLLTMDQVDLKHKRVLIREDLNVPMKDGKVTNDERIQRALPTIKQALAQKAKVMVMSHLGRPQEGDYGAKYSLEPVAEKLALALGQPVMLINEWVNGQFDVNAGEVVLLENVRYEVGENANDHKLAKKMAKLCDVFVMDAFATAHRAQASTAAIIECAPIACAGPLLMEELNALSNALSHPKRPLVAIVGGSKVSTKIQVLKNLLSIVDGLIVGGGIANTFLKAAGYNVGKSLYEADWVEATQELLQLAQTKKVALPLPVDVVVAHECSHAAKAVTKNIAEVTANEMILDIGPHTVAAYKPLLQDAKTIVWNGPVGVFEIPQFGHGTEAIAKIVAASNAYSIVGGGDTVAAVDQYHLADKISYISTGGGAFLEFLETKPLPAVELLAKRSKNMLKELTHENKRRTKIVATLGPATDSSEKMAELIAAGVNVVRLNFSHGAHEEHLRRIELVREAAKAQNKIVGILADLQGPKIRVAKFKNGKVTLTAGQKFCLDAALDELNGDETQVGIDYKELPDDVTQGDTLLLDDGRIRLRVEGVNGRRIECIVIDGGPLSNHKGINRMGGGLSAKALTPKDIKDMQFALQQHVDYIAISFPRSAQDMNEARSLMGDHEGKTGLIAKIERTEAVASIDEIIRASDGVMVARGDLAVEIGDAEVPVVQREIIHRARVLDKPVIVATQMMESMITSPVPTRAEVSDVATAVIENTDAVMLSAESAVGAHPALVVKTMVDVCKSVERQPMSQISGHRVELRFKRIDEAIAMATMYTANHLDIKAIVALTESGATPLWMSRIRTGIPVYGLSRYAHALGRMSLYRGVYPIYFDVTKCTRDSVNIEAIDCLVERGELQHGDRVILTKGDLLGVGGGANAMKILVVGNVQ